jgi:hypothetical protein
MLLSVIPYIKFTIILAIIGAVTFFWFDYKMLQAKSIELQNTISTFEQKFNQQALLIDEIKTNVEKQNKIRDDLKKDINKAQREAEKINNVVKDHDFAKIASRKRSLLEKKINNGTDDVIRCFEIVTGSIPKQNETNKNCPSLFSN